MEWTAFPRQRRLPTALVSSGLLGEEVCAEASVLELPAYKPDAVVVWPHLSACL